MQLRADIATAVLEQILRGGLTAYAYPAPWREPEPFDGEAHDDHRARRNVELAEYLTVLEHAEGENAGNLATCLRAIAWFRAAGCGDEARRILEHTHAEWRVRVECPDAQATTVALRHARRNDLRPARAAGYDEAAE